MFPSQMVRLKIVEPSSGPLFFHVSLKLQMVHVSLLALKLSNPQVAHFVHVSLANGTCFPP